MLNLKTHRLELRGIKNNVSQKTGSVYYVINCEDVDGEPFSFFCKDVGALPEGLKKGDIIVLNLTYNKYKDLNVVRVDKVS